MCHPIEIKSQYNISVYKVPSLVHLEEAADEL